MTSWTTRLRTHRWAWPQVRLPRLRTVLLSVLIVASVVGLVTAALLTVPVFRVRHVQVVGERQVTEDAVLQLAEVPRDTAMLRLPVDAISDRVATLPVVANVKVVRVWPDTVRIEIDERHPVAYTPLADGTYGLIDDHGVVYRAIANVPADLPKVVGTVALNAPDQPIDDTMQAAVDVASRLPESLAARVDSVWAASPYDVRLQLANGAQVRWGDPQRSALKAHVLRLLLLRHHAVVSHYDVSAPDVPATAP
jgi:cell division protein FtsQ